MAGPEKGRRESEQQQQPAAATPGKSVARGETGPPPPPPPPLAAKLQSCKGCHHQSNVRARPLQKRQGEGGEGKKFSKFLIDLQAGRRGEPSPETLCPLIGRRQPSSRLLLAGQSCPGGAGESRARAGWRNKRRESSETRFYCTFAFASRAQGWMVNLPFRKLPEAEDFPPCIVPPGPREKGNTRSSKTLLPNRRRP